MKKLLKRFKFFHYYSFLFSDLSGQNAGANKNVRDTPNDFSFVAFLGYKSMEYGVAYLCLGSLISKQYVLTTAACHNPKNNPIVEVILGVHDSAEERYCTGDYCPTGKVPSVYSLTQFLVPSFFCITPFRYLIAFA